MKSRGVKKWMFCFLTLTLALGNMALLAAEDGASDLKEKDGILAGIEGAASAASPNLFITELMPDTSNFAGYDAFEFVEIFNAGQTPVDLTSYRLQSGNWSKSFEPSFVLGARETAVFWTRREEIGPLTWEAFNSYYFSSYLSKYLPSERAFMISDVGGLVNSGTQTVTLLDASGAEIISAGYTGADAAEGKSVTFMYPEAGSHRMRPLASKQTPTPGWIEKGQAEPRGNEGGQRPNPPAEVKAVPGPGMVTLSWEGTGEPDVENYNIYKNGVLEFSVSSAEQQFQVYGLTGNVNYRFEITAVNRFDQESAMSEVVTTVPSHQIVTQVERAVNPYKDKYQALWDISEEGPVIPGLAQDLVPQGLAYDRAKDWLLAVYYMDDGRPGTLSVIDRASGRLVKSVLLMNEDGTPYTGHAGGVAVSPRYVWIASEEYLFQIEKEDLLRAENNQEIRFRSKIPVPVQASFNYYADGVLWVGEFYEKNSYPTDPSHHMTNRNGETQHAWMVGYELDRSTGSISAEDWMPGSEAPAVPGSILSIPGKVQGAVVRHDGIILSTSYGRGNDSMLYWYYNPLKQYAHAKTAIQGREIPVWFLDGTMEKKHNARLGIVPMSEGIVDAGSDLYVQLESGATKYRYTTTYVMDRMIKIDLKRWARYGLEEESLLQDSTDMDF